MPRSQMTRREVVVRDEGDERVYVEWFAGQGRQSFTRICTDDGATDETVIAADLKEVRSAVRGVRRELDTDDGPEGRLQRARQIGTVVSVVVSAVLTGLTVLIVGGLL